MVNMTKQKNISLKLQLELVQFYNGITLSIKENNTDNFRELWLVEEVSDSMDDQDQELLVLYYTNVMQVFETHLQHDMVLEFAFAALGSLDRIKDASSQTPTAVCFIDFFFFKISSSILAPYLVFHL
jgi:hypothetical protein